MTEGRGGDDEEPEPEDEVEISSHFPRIEKGKQFHSPLVVVEPENIPGSWIAEDMIRF